MASGGAGERAEEMEKGRFIKPLYPQILSMSPALPPNYRSHKFKARDSFCPGWGCGSDIIPHPRRNYTPKSFWDLNNKILITNHTGTRERNGSVGKALAISA